MPIKFTKRNFLGILLGFLVILGIGTIKIAIYVSIVKSVFPQQPDFVFIWLLQATSLLSLLIGGFIVGWIARKRGWIYGGLLGAVLALISLGLVVLPLLLPVSYVYGPDFPPDYGKEIARGNITKQLLDVPKTILLTSLGGFLGTYFYRRRSKNLT